MRAALSIGDYTTTPYYIAGIEIPVYCIEELAFCIKDNAFLLDSGLMRDELVEWIANRCNLKELARQLYPMVHRQGSLSAFVTLILEYTGLFDASTVKSISMLLKKNAGLSSIEKRKEKIDYLLINKKYTSAVRGYDALLEKWEEASGSTAELPAPGVKAAILHNKGTALAGMMQYERAAACFLKSYETCGGREEYVAYLAAMRMGLSESGYISFASELTEGYTATLQLEKSMERIKREWEKQADYQRLAMRREMRMGNDKQKYYDENDRLTQALKDNYRDCVGE
ncbi:MAG: hypothetical protein LUG83_02180 [Lachnospiraceae bacterium]|nr:hypothetical protein [Lachnospiraceae bacterium]